MSQKASTTVNIYEVDGAEVSPGTTKLLRVDSHWNYTDKLVVIRRGKCSWTVDAGELRRAIDNATHVRS